MKEAAIRIIIILNYIRCFPHLILFYFNKNRDVIKADTLRWLVVLKKNYKLPTGFIYLLVFFPEYRNLFYHRVGNFKYVLNPICPRMKTLIITTRSENIGEGLFLNIGISTAIGAKSIGKNCKIGHQVTIGNFEGKKPTIMDNVLIHPGAIIFGDLTIGNNSIIGANATVFKDVPDNSTVYPTSITMKWNKSNLQEDSNSKIFGGNAEIGQKP